VQEQRFEGSVQAKVAIRLEGGREERV